jgi:hypothetical protein
MKSPRCAYYGDRLFDGCGMVMERLQPSLLLVGEGIISSLNAAQVKLLGVDNAIKTRYLIGTYFLRLSLLQLVATNGAFMISQCNVVDIKYL